MLASIEMGRKWVGVKVDKKCPAIAVGESVSDEPNPQQVGTLSDGFALPPDF